MVGLKCKLRGTTLIETLVAMTIIVTAISLSFLSVVSIKKSFNNDLKTYAYMVVNKHLQELDFVNKVTDYDSFTIRTSREIYRKNPNLIILTVSAVTRDSVLLLEIKKIVMDIKYIKKTKAIDE